ncbi:MAG TPA: carbohydrate ABC transporter substrate-binding protein [Spirochaetia bacterium]|nr:carbohydrate ABC transporter substrate-binding protein [Spirochaetia bacterium]
MRRIWSLVFLTVLTFSTVWAEGSKETKGEGSVGAASGFANKTLNVAVFQGGYGRDYFDAVAAEFEKDYPGTKINVTASPRIWDVIRPQIVAGNPPDFVYLSEGDQGGLTVGMIKDRALLDIGDVFEMQALDQDAKLKDIILPGVLSSRFCNPYGDGKIYLAPYNYVVMGLWYNKNFFDTNGIQVPKTWDEFFALNAVAKKHGRALFTYQGIYPGYLEEIIFPAVWAAGGDEALKAFSNFDPNFWTSDAGKKTAALLERIGYTDNVLMKGTVALNHTQAQTEFMKGNAMFIVNGSWFESEMKDAPREEGFQFGFAGVPSFDPKTPVSCMASYETFFIPAKAKNPQLAKEFLRYLYTKKSVRLNGEKASGVMAVKGAVELVKDVITPAAYNTYKAVESGMYPVAGRWAVLPSNSKLVINDEVYNPIAGIMNRQMTGAEYAAKLDKIWKQARKEIDAASGQ